MGRVFWDNWLVWKALDPEHPVIYASASVLAVHQNHDYGCHPQANGGSLAARKLSGITNWREARDICGPPADAIEVIRTGGVKPNYLRYWATAKRYARRAWHLIPVSGCVQESRSALLHYPMASTSCLAFRRAALEKLLPVPETLRSQADAFLTALVIFIAPIAAVEDYLGKYRLHATNLFQTTTAKPSPQQIQHRMAVRAALLVEIQSWLRRHGHDLRSADLRAYVQQWQNAFEQGGFPMQPPVRWKYFRHLLGYPWTYG